MFLANWPPANGGGSDFVLNHFKQKRLSVGDKRKAERESAYALSPTDYYRQLVKWRSLKLN
jgi:hypothetical protein